MATRLASVHVLAPRVGVRPSEVSDAPDMSRAEALRRLLRAHRRARASQRLAARQPVRSWAGWLRGVWMS